MSSLVQPEENIYELNRIQLRLFLIQHQCEELLPVLQKYSGEELKRKDPHLLWSYNTDKVFLYNSLIYEPVKLPLKISRVFYYPGYCFQRKYQYHWEGGFEYRYARRTAIRTFLLASQRVLNDLHSDVLTYILSFLTPEQIGKDIPVNSWNLNISKGVDYVEKSIQGIYCQIGHNYNGPTSCEHCRKKKVEYHNLLVRRSMQMCQIPSSYGRYSELPDQNIHKKILEMENELAEHQSKLNQYYGRFDRRCAEFQIC